jgi:uncharacterized protein
VLIGAERPPSEVAPAALASTVITSLAGVVTFTILATQQHGSVAPDWTTGAALGLGGLAGPTPGPGCSPGCRRPRFVASSAFS